MSQQRPSEPDPAQKPTHSECNSLQNVYAGQLSCVFEGGGQNSVFLIPVTAADRIDHLKDVIYPKGFNDAGFLAKDLALFKVDIDPHEHTEDSLKKLKYNEGNPAFKRLYPLETLSSYWPSQPDSTKINVFVKPPAFGPVKGTSYSDQSQQNANAYTLSCLIQGESQEDIFLCQVPATLEIGLLKNVIYEKGFTNVGFLAKHLTLFKFKVDIDHFKYTEDLFEKLEYNGDDAVFEILSTLRTVSSYWPSRPDYAKINVFVKPPASVLDNRGVKRKHSEQDEPTDEEKFLQNFAKQSPSSLSTPSNFKPFGGRIICLNRPFEAGTIPITLLQQEFAQFTDDLELMPHVKGKQLLDDLTPVACQWHENENARRDVVGGKFKEAGLELVIQTMPNSGFTTDGNLSHPIMPPIIRECKNEYGCALFQAVSYYSNYLTAVFSQPEYKNKTCFPSILMLDIGPCIAFYGCLWTGLRVHAEPLTPWYDLGTHWQNDKIRQSIAACLSAVFNTVERLCKHYAKLSTLGNRNCAYPYPTSYKNEDGHKIQFSYTERFSDKLVFAALSEGKPIVVKFTRRYSAEAHQFLARSDSAPRLRAVENIPGGWMMVVMDFSHYTLLDELWLTLHHELRMKVIRKLTGIVSGLHQQGFVHGDIRLVNILVDKAILLAGGEFGIHLLDVEWAGKIGDAKYPAGVNTNTVVRPSGVKGGADITVDHDMEMIEYMIK